jgi:methanogenic corrinoid protein MtbC1
MPVPRKQQSEWFPHLVYERTQTELVTLKSSLPEASVKDLAREVLTRMAARGGAAQWPSPIPNPADLEALCHALVSENKADGARYIQELQADGATADQVYLGYLAGAARTLGDWWDDDRISFSEVTIGSSRIYAIMRSLSHLFVPRNFLSERSAVFASVPDETHTLGVRMAADLFRRDGWEIQLKVGYDYDALVDELVGSRCPLIGLSAGGRHSAELLARLIVALRILRPEALILVSGKIVDEAAELVAVMGADAVANDIPSARDAMDTLWNAVDRRKV